MAELLTFTGSVPCILHLRGAKHFTCIVLPKPRAGSTRRLVLFINGKADAKTVGNLYKAGVRKHSFGGYWVSEKMKEEEQH